MEKGRIAMIGDVGGTNIRLELIKVDIDADQPTSIKEGKFNVEKYDSFQLAVETFLKEVDQSSYPEVAVVGIAGPITNNTVFMANVGKWGVLDGNQLAINLNIKQFVFLNDFEAASYGILLVPKDQFVSINGLEAD